MAYILIKNLIEITRGSKMCVTTLRKKSYVGVGMEKEGNLTMW